MDFLKGMMEMKEAREMERISCSIEVQVQGLHSVMGIHVKCIDSRIGS